MSQNNKQHNKNKKGNHDDCDDCKRQKKQNTALISIYQRLQSVRGRAKNVKDSLDFHMTQSFILDKRVKQLDKRYDQIPDRNYSVQQVKDLGFNLASRIFQNKIMNKLQQQNIKLKDTLKKMHSERVKRINQQSLWQEMRQIQGLKLGNSTAQSQGFQKPRSSNESQINRLLFTKSPHLNNQDNLWKEVSSTKSSNFRQTNNQSKQIIQQANQQQRQKKISSLNYQMLKSSLWLYQNQKNNLLQKQLLQSSKPKIARFNKPLRKGLILPAVKIQK